MTRHRCWEPELDLRHCNNEGAGGRPNRASVGRGGQTIRPAPRGGQRAIMTACSRLALVAAALVARATSVRRNRRHRQRQYVRVVDGVADESIGQDTSAQSPTTPDKVFRRNVSDFCTIPEPQEQWTRGDAMRWRDKAAAVGTSGDSGQHSCANACSRSCSRGSCSPERRGPDPVPRGAGQTCCCCNFPRSAGPAKQWLGRRSETISSAEAFAGPESRTLPGLWPPGGRRRCRLGCVPPFPEGGHDIRRLAASCMDKMVSAELSKRSSH